MTSPGDCILRSSDRVDHKVFRCILSLASTVFASMFDLSQTPNATSQNSDTADLPVISVSEPSSVLSTMLLLIYPCGFFSFSNLDLVIDIAKAYDKYDLDTQSLRRYLNEILVSDKMLLGNPLGVYSVAWRLDMKEEAQNASKYLHTLDLNAKAVKEGFFSWAESGGWDAMLALWDLRMRREEALDGPIDVALGAGPCPRQHLALATTKAKTRVTLNKPNPSCFELTSFLGIQQLSPGCRDCTKFFNFPHSEVRIKRDMSFVSSFPQTITWKST
ncbi:hypothetical protein FRB94_005181 [Tulasnella sp. JGI-2019a]|nr:hypothetical protein FRB94_005181 [Tulasnella sp. JGI-2019a]